MLIQGVLAAPTAKRDYIALNESGVVQFWSSACVAQRRGSDACERCELACPLQSLHGTGDTPSLDASCIGCGKCAAACPTGALRVTGFDAIDAIPKGRPIRVECAKVPVKLTRTSSLIPFKFSQTYTFRVPCLGGVSAAQWLELSAHAKDTQVILVDRNWCQQCSAGQCRPLQHPAEQTLAQAQEILCELGWDPKRQPQLCLEPLPIALMPKHIPSDAPLSLGRRAFFQRIGTEAHGTVVKKPLSKGWTPRTLQVQRMPLPQRERLLAIIRQLSSADKQRMPVAPYREITVSANCDHNGVCASVCPSGALELFEDTQGAGLNFDANRCLDCGLCVKSCPQQALSMRPASVAPQASIHRILTHDQVKCQHCLKYFYGSAHSADTCSDCKRNRQMGSGLFGSLSITNKPLA